MYIESWCHQTILSSVATFSSCFLSSQQEGPSSESFFASGGQSIRASASPTVLPMNIQDWFPLGSNGLISLQSKGLLRVFSSTTVWKHQFFRVQTSLWSNSHIHTWLLEKAVLTKWTILSKVMPLPFNTLSRFVIAYFLRSKRLNFMATVTICSDFGAQESKNLPLFPLFTHLYAMKWWDQCHDIHFCMLSFKLAFLLSSFTFIKRLISSSSSSDVRVMSSAYLRLLIFLLAILIPDCTSSSLVFHMMYSAYKLNKGGDGIQPWHSPFIILSQSVAPCLVLTIASWLPYIFLRR